MGGLVVVVVAVVAVVVVVVVVIVEFLLCRMDDYGLSSRSGLQNCLTHWGTQFENFCSKGRTFQKQNELNTLSCYANLRDILSQFSDNETHIDVANKLKANRVPAGGLQDASLTDRKTTGGFF